MLLDVTNGFASQPYRSWLQEEGDTIKLFSNEEFFSKADYIVEVKSEGIHSPIYYDIGENYNPDELYTSLCLVVTYVYKNNSDISIFPGNILHYIRKGGMAVKPVEGMLLGEGEVIQTPYPVDYDTKERGYTMSDICPTFILFMKKSDYPENPDKSVRKGHPKVSMMQDIKRACIKINDDVGSVWGLSDLHFDNRYELYKYMERFEGVNVPLSDPEQMWWDLRYHKNVFDQYRKERNIDWKTPAERTQEDIDAFNRLMEMKVRIAKENREKKKSEQGQLNNTNIHYA